ncbi:hypothetical protein KY327_00780 [Candidatus Woesearchaeota archaeon]|nr:hypothetical protein [Candidatus Woesearchaeota archaeon]
MARQKDDTAKELRSFLKKAQEELEKFQDDNKSAWEGAVERKETAEEFIRKHPFISAGGALIAGYFLGRLFKKRRR